MFLRVLGGGELRGDRVVRFSYLDESGTSNPDQEPILVVAGVIVDADRQCKNIERYLLEMADEYVPKNKRKQFRDEGFHALELTSGGKVFNKVDGTFGRAYEILCKLCRIPKTFNLPVVYGFVNRQELHAAYPSEDKKPLDKHGQVMAAIQCSIRIEKFMREPEREQEITMLIYEDAPQCRKMIKNMQAFLRSKESKSWAYDGADFLPFAKISEDPLFSGKSDSSILAVADSVAYAIKRKLMGKACDDLYEPLHELAMKTSYPARVDLVLSGA